MFLCLGAHMSFRLCFLVLLTTAPYAGQAHNDCLEHKVTAGDLVNRSKGCPNNDRIKELCGVVKDGKEEEIDSEYYFVHQTIISNGACVTSNDSEEDKRKKIQLYWNKYGKDVSCSNVNFKGGSLLRFAIYYESDRFIEDIIKKWKLSSEYFNQPDKHDGKTVLDYIASEIKACTSPLVKKKLQFYYDKLSEAGAKHST